MRLPVSALSTLYISEYEFIKRYIWGIRTETEEMRRGRELHRKYGGAYVPFEKLRGRAREVILKGTFLTGIADEVEKGDSVTIYEDKMNPIWKIHRVQLYGYGYIVREVFPGRILLVLRDVHDLREVHREEYRQDHGEMVESLFLRAVELMKYWSRSGQRRTSRGGR